jgi:predicted acylesterase/phospholipase RssA
MGIKHLVISGCGPEMLRYLGCIKYLMQNNYFSINDIENIYCTSAGSIIALCIILEYDFETLEEYFINRPWNNLYNITAKHILLFYKSKGLFGKKEIEESLNPLLKGKGLKSDITLKELYEFKKIRLIVNSVGINVQQNMNNEYFDYLSHPNLKLFDIIQMTSTIPLFIEPLVYQEKFYVDGGALVNYNSKICLDNHKDNECFGLNYSVEIEKQEKEFANFNLLDFFAIYNSANLSYTLKFNKTPKLSNEICNKLSFSPFNINNIKKFINDKEFRKTLFNNGIEDGVKYLESRI